MLLPLLKSDLYEVILNTLNVKLVSNAPVWHQDSSAVTVVMASAGYPGSYKKGVEITGMHDSAAQQGRGFIQSASSDYTLQIKSFFLLVRAKVDAELESINAISLQFI